MPVRMKRPGKEPEEPKKRERNVNSIPTRKAASPPHRSYALYGRSGTGKTTLLSTFPKPLLIADVRDQGDESVADIPGVTVMDIRTREDFDDLYWYLKKHGDKYKTIGVDTITQLQQMVVEEVSRNTRKRAGDWGSMTKQQWGEVAGVLKDYITDFRNLEMNVVFIAQDRVFNIDDESDPDADLEPEVGPRLMPSVASHMNASVSIIGNTFIRQRRRKKEVNGKKREVTTLQYCLRVGPNPVYVTKVRKPKKISLPEFIENPEYDDIIDLVKGR